MYLPKFVNRDKYILENLTVFFQLLRKIAAYIPEFNVFTMLSMSFSELFKRLRWEFACTKFVSLFTVGNNGDAVCFKKIQKMFQFLNKSDLPLHTLVV